MDEEMYKNISNKLNKAMTWLFEIYQNDYKQIADILSAWDFSYGELACVLTDTNLSIAEITEILNEIEEV